MTTPLFALEEERDFLLVSLDDLEIELRAGDMSKADYDALKDDYTVRAADLIREIAERKSDAGKRAGRSGKSGADNSSKAQSRWPKLAMVVAGLALFSVGAGWLLAQAVGERGASDSLTGDIPETAREKVVTCQGLMSGGELRESLVCFDEVLDEDPQNVEALTYRGWFLILASGTAQQNGDTESYEQLVERGEASLDDAVAVNPGFADARAFRVVVYKNTAREAEACEELAVLEGLDPAPMITSLIQPIADSLVCEGEDAG